MKSPPKPAAAVALATVLANFMPSRSASPRVTQQPVGATGGQNVQR
jgi:hypothetical protein